MNKKQNSILIIVPAYNESQNIVNVIESLTKENPEWDIIVINDGSIDNTGELAESTGKAFVINLSYKIGIGSSVQTGFKFAGKYNYDFALQFDGDGQHKASEINKLLEVVKNKKADVVIGSRFCTKNSIYKPTFLRYLGIKIFEIVNSFLIHQKVTDNTSGFRAYNKKAINFLAESYPSDYPEPEAIILLGKNGFRIKEVFAEMQQRQGGVSSISGLKNIYYMIKVLLSVFLTSTRPKIIMNGKKFKLLKKGSHYE